MPLSKILTNSFSTLVLSGDNLANNSIDNSKLKTQIIVANNIVAGAVIGPRIGPNAINANNIANNVITGDKLTTGSFTSNIFAANTVTGDKIGQGAISANNFAPGAIAAAGGSGGVGSVQVFTSPGTFNIPVTTFKIKVTVVGGGGPGGSAGSFVSEASGIGGSGGGGGTAVKWIDAPYPVTAVPVTVGVASGTSSFGAYASATGGGAGAASPSGGSAGGSGSGGVGSNGTLNIRGADGLSSWPTQIAIGGGSFFAQPNMTSLGPNSPGVAGKYYGGGGTGAYWIGPGSSAPGGAGNTGIVIVEY
jgi:hypothetical protein